MAQGVVKWFDRSRGFGYISPDDGGAEVFVLHTAIAAPLGEGFRMMTAGSRVEFITRQGSKGPEAVRVSALER